MILIPSQKGQLGNHLFNIAHFAATALEHDLFISYPCFNYPINQFQSLGKKTNHLRVKESSKKRNKSRRKFFKQVHRYCPSSYFHRSLVNHGEPHIDTSGKLFLKDAKKKLMICKGFGFRDEKNFIKHQDQLRKIFSLNESIRSSVTQYQELLAIQTNSVVVGFHIRRSDYQFYRSGEYYFSDAEWKQWFHQIQNLFESRGKHLIGLVFSDEDVSSLISKNNSFQLGPGDMFEDLEMMSRCDYLLGPPSTFSAWASFMGEVPFLRLEKGTQQITLESFNKNYSYSP